MLDLPAGWIEQYQDGCVLAAVGDEGRSGFSPNINLVIQGPPQTDYLVSTLDQLRSALPGFYLVDVEGHDSNDWLTLSFGHIQRGWRLASIQRHLANSDATVIATATCAAADLFDSYPLMASTACSLRLTK